ncbi:MAG: flagellar protein FlgN [Desulfovibrio sp.]|uniref:flagellar protein FlgN n=1 Tax=Desulfovibrio sp. TaxID=885 RepID=UPI002583840C|nr:flagellar protein FlgN [Desulfovibrio sp.]MCD7983534.1 flagellar protein FlgN [Desulfovibrio sp.]
MYQRIQESLSRQDKALALLRDLLEEEYRILLSRDTDGVVAQEFSIQELIRQLAVEKAVVIKALDGVRVTEYARSLPEEQGGALLELFRAVDSYEQEVSRQASRNAQLSLALLDQSSRTLQALTSKAMPPRTETYGRRGGMRPEAHPQAAIISGRL